MTNGLNRYEKEALADFMENEANQLDATISEIEHSKSEKTATISDGKKDLKELDNNNEQRVATISALQTIERLGRKAES